MGHRALDRELVGAFEDEPRGLLGDCLKSQRCQLGVGGGLGTPSGKRRRDDRGDLLGDGGADRKRAFAQELGRAFGRDQDQTPGHRVVADCLEEGAHRGHQHRCRVVRVGLLGDQGHQLLDRAGALALDHRSQEAG